MEITAIRKRSQVLEEEKWDVASIYQNTEDWKAAVSALKEHLTEFQSYRGNLGKSAIRMYDGIEQYHKLSVTLGSIWVYAHLRKDEDTTNPVFQELYEKANKLKSQFSESTAFFEPELLSIDRAILSLYLDQNESLKQYELFFRFLEEKRPHVLSEAEERFLSKAQESLGSSNKTYSMFTNADLRFPEIYSDNGKSIPVTQGRFVSLLNNPNREVRRQAYESVYKTYEQYGNTVAALLSGEVKARSFNASIRNYKNAREAALKTNVIPEQVYEQLVDTVNEHLPLLHRYLKLRKSLLKLDEMYMYDVYTPVVKGVEMPYSYEEAKETLLNALQPLGEEYVSIVERGFEEKWVDVYENEGKQGGAYSSGSYSTKPFILMNWQGSHESLTTLAHEFGHSVHSYYTRKHQKPVYGYYTIFLAEVASTLNEALLHEYLLKKETNKQKKLYLLNQFLEGIRTTVFRQTMFAEFEHFLHTDYENGEALTKERLSTFYFELNKKYYGNAVVSDELIAYEWARIPHFYMNYYVYQYATGYSAATALAKQVLQEGEPAAERFIRFLKSGISDYPIELLRNAGVDMRTKEPVADTMFLFEHTLNEMEKLINS